MSLETQFTNMLNGVILNNKGEVMDKKLITDDIMATMLCIMRDREAYMKAKQSGDDVEARKAMTQLLGMYASINPKTIIKYIHNNNIQDIKQSG